MAIKPKQLHLILLLLSCLGFFALTYIFNEKDHGKFFIKYNSRQRFPARSQPVNRDLKLLKDFFKPNTFGSLIDYQLSAKTYLDLSNDKDNSKLAKNFKDQIKSYITENYIQRLRQGIRYQPNKKGNSSYIEKENIIDHISNNLISFSKQHKLNSGELKVDLIFNPIVSKSFSFRNQMNSNQLINYSNQNTLSSFIKSKSPRYTKNIFQTKIPSNGNTYQYIGGVISISVKNSKKDLSGTIRLRRYFRINRISDLDMTINSKLFDLEIVHFKSEFFQKLPIITVDIVKNFKKTIASQELSYLNIYFDKILSTASYSQQEENSTIKTGELYFKGNTPATKYKANIHLLSWSFKNESFDNKSKMTIELIKPRFDMNYGEIKNNIRNNIIMKYAPNIIKEMKLSRFHKDLGFEQR
jgi:hypothetical protein